jgi:hypothetical protein
MIGKYILKLASKAIYPAECLIKAGSFLLNAGLELRSCSSGKG